MYVEYIMLYSYSLEKETRAFSFWAVLYKEIYVALNQLWTVTAKLFRSLKKKEKDHYVLVVRQEAS